jgi:hypothetical protein
MISARLAVPDAAIGNEARERDGRARLRISETLKLFC